MEDFLQATEQGLERGAALLESISGVRGGEEHCCWESRAATGEVQAKTHCRQQGLPARHPSHLTQDRGGAYITTDLHFKSSIILRHTSVPYMLLTTECFFCQES